jgi:hypothetical protein
MRAGRLLAVCFAAGCGLTFVLLSLMLTFRPIAPVCEALLQPAGWIARKTDPTVILIAIPIQIAVYTLGFFVVALSVSRIRRGRLNKDMSISPKRAGS